jgi:hypothetical protein
VDWVILIIMEKKKKIEKSSQWCVRGGFTEEEEKW